MFNTHLLSAAGTGTYIREQCPATQPQPTPESKGKVIALFNWAPRREDILVLAPHILNLGTSYASYAPAALRPGKEPLVSIG
jgi:hypothetical protein